MTSLNNDCPICKNPLPSLRRVVTPCDHYFCTECFFKWIKEGKNCPLCRKTFIEDPEEEEAHNTLVAINQQIVTDYDIMTHLRDNNSILTIQNMKLQESNGLLAQEKLIELQRQVDYKKDWLDLYNTKISIHRMQSERNQ